MSTSALRVAIIGSGFAGLGAAVKLKQAGVKDIVILERADNVGGTWRDNTYPGAACDIPSHLYSFSFAPKADWSSHYAGQEEIQAYLEECVDRFGLRFHLRLGRSVRHARYDEASATWEITADTGEVFTADVLVPALGALRDPAWPEIEGRDDFRGAQMHTARWDHDYDFTGKRVAVVGTGASAIQVAPELAKTAAEVHIMQRTPAWIVPRKDRRYPAWVQRLFAKVPALAKLHRGVIYGLLEARFVFFGRSVTLNRIGAKALGGFMRAQVKDPTLHAALTPDYRMGCKRILISDDWYRMFNRPNVDLHTGGLSHVTTDGLALADGSHVELDAIVWATGFDVREMLGVLDITGRGGAQLRERWSDRPTAYMGMTVPDFPNMFLLVGPNTGLGHNSMVYMMESQFPHLLAGVRRAAQLRGSGAVEVKPEAVERFMTYVDGKHGDYVWASGCRSWYIDDEGRNFTLWPGTAMRFRHAARRFHPADYRVVAATAPGGSPDRVVDLHVDDEDSISA
jgi:cation diffusion facilitator CzcD-associated flavoprotein CzcO